MKISVASCSETGQRQRNDDVLGSWIGEHAACFVVCDGVGGYAGGDRAATLVRDRLLTGVSQLEQLTLQHSQAAIAAVEQAICAAQLSDADCAQMSTTLAALFTDRDRQRVWWAHAGDSRIYHFRRGQLAGVTRDHSLRQQFADAGYENAGINGHLLYNALGGHHAPYVSWHSELNVEDGDAFLLCSDGFWNPLSAADMALALRLVNSPDEWLALLLQAIAPAARNDNLSAVAVWFGSPQETTLLISPTDAARFLPSRE